MRVGRGTPERRPMEGMVEDDNSGKGKEGGIILAGATTCARPAGIVAGRPLLATRRRRGLRRAAAWASVADLGLGRR